jgi:hypothetical protein
VTLLRAALLDFLVCFHVVGGAVLFRRFFPRESTWLGFFVPILALMAVLNFVEHFMALPLLGWLLPITLGLCFWGMLSARGIWKELCVPGLLFVVAVTYILIIRGLHPEIPSWTEGLADLNRVLDFCLGDKVPPTDSWLPPYDHGGYYTFQHYGASILKRLFVLDIGTGYNLSYVLLDALICQAAGAVAFSLSGKNWIAAAIMLVVAASFTGSAGIMLFCNPSGIDILLQYDLHHGWADEHHNPLWWLLAADPHQQRTRLYTPGNGIYMPEFHANLGGHFLTLLALFALVETFKPLRSNGPWILLAVLPALTIITATWFLPVILVFCLGGVLALATKQRPQNGRLVILVSVIAIGLILPSVLRLVGDSYPQPLRLTLPAEHTYPWLFIEQWWPVYIPWLFLCFIWRRLPLEAQFLHGAVPLLLVVFEICTIGTREPTLEKIWSALYGAGLVVFLSLVFLQKTGPFRLLTMVMLFISVLSLRSWWIESTRGVDPASGFFRLQGDVALQNDPQRKRLLQAMQRLRGATILTGKSYWAYGLPPAVAAFSENRCFEGWSYPSQLAGHGEVPIVRDNLCDQFYAGQMTAPLPFLADNHIAAVLIWPDDAISNDLLAQLQDRLSPAYYYVDCKGEGGRNAGVFFRLPRR